MTGVGELVDRIGVRLHPTRDDTATLPLSPAVVRNGEMLVAGMMLAADLASGIRLHDAYVTTVLTTSFSFRRAARGYVGPVTAVAAPLFADGRRAVDRIDFCNGEGGSIATGLISFVVRRADTPYSRDVYSKYRSAWTQPIEAPLSEAAGIEVADAATGRVTLHAGDDVRREGGIVQGAFVTLLGEASALAFAEHTLQAPAVVESLNVDYLAPVGNDPVATEARWLAAPGESDIEVVLHDDTTGSVLAVFVIGVARAISR
ncbi:MAG: hypothetical protein K8R99_09915 [Actinomycetia bacterium]|nr:hypothetical protein [Actinomycetes bacterium]